MTTRECDRAAAELSSAAIVAQAVCAFTDGETRTLYASSFSFVDAFIISVRPPPVGTVFTLTLCPKGRSSLPPIVARVMHTRIDPSNLCNSGFGVMFTNVEGMMIEALGEALEALGLPSKASADDRRPERRRNPRIATPFTAILAAPEGPFQMKVSNLSMSGALLVSDGDMPPELELGIVTGVDIVKPDAPETISLRAEIARLVFDGETTALGVDFVELDETAGRRIEGLMLNALIAVADRSESR
jgi:hypothetical protein